MDIGKRISDLRKKQGMTQEQLAEKLGTTRQAVSKWEADKSFPDIDYVVRMGDIFQVSMDYLLLGKENEVQRKEVQADSQDVDKKDIYKLYRIIFIVLTFVGGSILLLLPLIASLYRNQVFGPRYTNANVYLKEWPLIGVVILGVIMTAVGIGGIIWANRKEKDN